MSRVWWGNPRQAAVHPWMGRGRPPAGLAGFTGQGPPLRGRLRLGPSLCPPWLAGDSIHVWASLARDEPRGEPLAAFCHGGRARPAIANTATGIVFGFNWQQALDWVLLERYLAPRPPLQARLPFHHHLVPARLRLMIARVTTAWARRRPPAFPAWPVEPAVEALRYVLARAAALSGAGGETPGLGRSARPMVVLTHDIDTAAGGGPALEMAGMEEEAGFRSTWFVVPCRGGVLSRLRPCLDRLYAAGHEIGVHGFDHGNRTPFLPPADLGRRLDCARAALADYCPRGYRSPGLVRTPALYEQLEGRFDYDSSVPDTELYTAAGRGNGCGSTIPFRRGSLLVLPVTLPLDALLIHYGFGPREISALWAEKLAWLGRVGGIGVCVTHAEPHYGGRRGMLRWYREFLAGLRRRGADVRTAVGALAPRSTRGGE